MQLSRRIAGLLSSSSQAAKWETLRSAPVLQSYMSTDSTRKTASRKSTKASTAQPRVSKTLSGFESSEEIGGIEADLLQNSVKPADEAAAKPVEENCAKSAAGAPELPKPSQIPWQTKVANSVNLIGYLGAPIQLDVSPNGHHTAFSILVSEKSHDLPHFWIPIVFRDDLAQIAACNLREKDYVYVTGQLTGQPDPADNNSENKVQVSVNSISYVLELSTEKDSKKNDETWDRSSAKEKDDALWNDLFQNPHKWWDNRSKDNKASGSFKHKESAHILMVNESTPEWVLSKLDCLLSNRTISAGQKKLGDSSKGANRWADFLENPDEWKDNRGGKRTGKLNPKFPDFSHMGTNDGLWLDSAPASVLLKLETALSGSTGNPIRKGQDVKDFASPKLEVYQSERKSFQTDSYAKALEERWKDFAENPNRWWDNRTNKRNPKSPDFKHKDTGEALWLTDPSTPSWAHAMFLSPMS